MSKARRKTNFTHTVYCRNEECEGEIEVSYYPGHAAQTYGPPERCYPADPDEIETPDECPDCKVEITERDRDRWCVEIAERGDDDDRY